MTVTAAITNPRHRRLWAGLLIGTLATAALLALEAAFRPAAQANLYFQEWSSEAMMQTVSLVDLRDAPVQSLWYLHIQPPMFDALRALLAGARRSGDALTMLRHVDASLYVLWAVLYGMTGCVLFWWLADLTDGKFAAVATAVFLGHPASIFYATLLETTLLSTFLILCLCYLLWQIRVGRPLSGVWLALVFLSLYLTRSIFQWPWLLFLLVCLTLLRFPVRRLIAFCVVAGAAVGLYTVKQLSLFQISGTSSFVGMNLCNSIGCPGMWDGYSDAAAPVEQPGTSEPQVLARVRKLDGSLNLNHAQYLAVNRQLQETYRRQLVDTPPLVLLQTWLSNLKVFLRPSSRYTDHVIVDRLPHRAAYDFVFSFPVLPVLLIGAAVSWLVRARVNDLRYALGLTLPVLFVALLGVVGERGENMRFKFFIEPVLFVFLCAQLHGARTAITSSISRFLDLFRRVFRRDRRSPRAQKGF